MYFFMYSFFFFILSSTFLSGASPIVYVLNRMMRSVEHNYIEIHCIWCIVLYRQHVLTLYRGHHQARILAGRRTHYDFYKLLLRPDDDPLRGSKHVAWIKLYNRYDIFQYSFVQSISIFLLSPTCFTCYLHPSSGAQLQRTAMGVCICGRQRL
jgi:hypothetical protein